MANSINIRFPFKDTYGGGVFETTKTSEMAYQSDLISLLTTRRGHRVMRSELFSPIYDYIMEPLDDISMQELKRDVEDKIRRFIPQIEVKRVLTTPDYENSALTIKIVYTIKEYFNVEKTLDLVFPMQQQ